MVEFSVKIQAKDLYDFMLKHHYSTAGGILGSGMGAVCILVGYNRREWLFVILGLIVLFYLPVSLYMKSKQQALLNPVFKTPLQYSMTEEGITVSQGETSQLVAWDMIDRAISTQRSIILYTSRINAMIFPKDQLGDQRVQVIGMVATHVPPKKMKIRY